MRRVAPKRKAQRKEKRTAEGEGRYRRGGEAEMKIEKEKSRGNSKECIYKIHKGYTCMH